MSTSILVYGPQGTQKTRHAKAIALHYGMTRIVEEAESLSPAALKRLAVSQPTLFISNAEPSGFPSDGLRHIRVIPFSEAVAAATVSNPVNQADQE